MRPPSRHNEPPAARQPAFGYCGGRRLEAAKWRPLVFLGRDDLAALVHAGLQVDMVRTLQLARFLVFMEAVRAERMVRTPHVAPRRRSFSLGNGHRKSRTV